MRLGAVWSGSVGLDELLRHLLGGPGLVVTSTLTVMTTTSYLNSLVQFQLPLDLHVYYTMPYSTLPYYTILYYTILYYTILYYTITYYDIPYHTILYYTILYYTILYYTILYYTILYTITYYDIPYYAFELLGSLPPGKAELSSSQCRRHRGSQEASEPQAAELGVQGSSGRAPRFKALY